MQPSRRTQIRQLLPCLARMRQWLFILLVYQQHCAGQYGHAADFRGQGQVMSLRSVFLERSNPEIARMSAGFTISAWVNLQTSDQRAYTAIHSEFSMQLASATINFVGGFLSWSFDTNVRAMDLLRPLVGDGFANGWHHFMVAWNASSIERTVYLDGTLILRELAPDFEFTDWLSYEPVLLFGLHCYLNTHADLTAPTSCRVPSFEGALDDFAMYAGPLGGAEIAERWNRSLTNRQARGLEPDLILFYNFNNCSNGVCPNLGSAGLEYDLMLGRLKPGAMGSTMRIMDGARELHLLPPTLVSAASIPRVDADDYAPLVVAIASGLTSTVRGGDVVPFNYTAPIPFDAAVTWYVPTTSGSTTAVLIMPLHIDGPQVNLEYHLRVRVLEDQVRHRRPRTRPPLLVLLIKYYLSSPPSLS